MQLSSANIALSVLKLSAAISGPVVQSAVAVEPSSACETSSIEEAGHAGDRYVSAYDMPDDDTMAFCKASREAYQAIRDGSKSPFDSEIADLVGSRRLWQSQNTDARIQFEGDFVASEGVAAGTQAPQRDADFPSRRDAMANAYHFASALVENVKYVVSDTREIASDPDKYLDTSGRLYGAGPGGGTAGGDWQVAMAKGTDMMLFYRDRMESMAASLANLFSFDSTSVTVPAYDGGFQGFSITHGTLGKIMDVARDGSITLYDAEGTAYSAEEYNVANIDGGIPQLHNDLIRQADDRAALASRGLRSEVSGGIVRL